MASTRDVDGSSPDPAGPDPHPRSWAGAGTLAAWGFAFLLLRVFAVSGYDWDTAFLVSTTLGLDDGLALLFGSLMASWRLTAVLLACLLPLLIAAALWSGRRHRAVMTLLAVLGVVLLVSLTVSHRLWWPPVATAVVLAGFALIRRLPTVHWARRMFTTALARTGLLIGAGMLLAAAFDQTPWLPLERVETTHGTVVGYVLRVDSGYLNVLTQDQEFVIVLSDDVLSRT